VAELVADALDDELLAGVLEVELVDDGLELELHPPITSAIAATATTPPATRARLCISMVLTPPRERAPEAIQLDLCPRSCKTYSGQLSEIKIKIYLFQRFYQVAADANAGSKTRWQDFVVAR
jgi:hypothetical protein